jgi:hypothetical protein
VLLQVIQRRRDGVLFAEFLEAAFDGIVLHVGGAGKLVAFEKPIVTAGWAFANQFRLDAKLLFGAIDGADAEAEVASPGPDFVRGAWSVLEEFFEQDTSLVDAATVADGSGDGAGEKVLGAERTWAAPVEGGNGGWAKLVGQAWLGWGEVVLDLR